jgi:hypothetical protein
LSALTSTVIRVPLWVLVGVNVASVSPLISVPSANQL